MSEQHARHRLDELLLNPVRLSIMAALASVDEARFSVVRDKVEVTDSVLSKQVGVLAGVGHGYLLIRKGHVGKWPRTWLSLTPGGRAAYERHLEALREIAGG